MPFADKHPNARLDLLRGAANGMIALAIRVVAGAEAPGQLTMQELYAPLE
jgi:hypothetical protein